MKKRKIMKINKKTIKIVNKMRNQIMIITKIKSKMKVRINLLPKLMRI